MKIRNVVFAMSSVIILTLPLLACADTSPWPDLELQVIKTQSVFEDVQNRANDLRSFITSVNPNYYSKTNEKELAEISNDLDNQLFDLGLKLDELKSSIKYEADNRR
ncbi:MAG: hypothetical protein Q8Q07_00980 [Dehalococcoidales bacterium]|nr:hypothetical protein [Dehalococcoidales bacterium]